MVFELVVARLLVVSRLLFLVSRSIIAVRRSFPPKNETTNPDLEYQLLQLNTTPISISIKSPHPKPPFLHTSSYHGRPFRARVEIPSALSLPQRKARDQADSGTGHVFGKPTRKESCYDNLHISRNAWDTNLVKVRAACLVFERRVELIMNPGKSRIPRRQLGSQRWRRFCSRTSQREGSLA